MTGRFDGTSRLRGFSGAGGEVWRDGVVEAREVAGRRETSMLQGARWREQEHEAALLQSVAGATGGQPAEPREPREHYEFRRAVARG